MCSKTEVMATLMRTYLFSRVFGCSRLSRDYEAHGTFKKYWYYQHMGCVISLGQGKANHLKEVNISPYNFKGHDLNGIMVDHALSFGINWITKEYELY